MEIKAMGKTVATQTRATVIVALALVMIAGGLDLASLVVLPEVGKLTCSVVIGVYAIAELIKRVK